MTTVILLTPHSGGLDYDFDKNSKYRRKKVLMSTAGPANLFEKIGIAQKHGLTIVNSFHLN
jgi:hypothetical protein